MSRKVLVVDDDKSVLSLVGRYLTGAGFSVVSTDNGSEGLMLVRESRPDLVLVDSDMPGLDGHAVCRVLKKDAETRSIPVVIMSGAHTADADVVSGFSGGADDYVTKPFSLPVLTARLEAVLRRYQPTAQMGKMLRKSGIELDPAGRTVKAAGKNVSLTRKEFDLLALLIEKAGRVLSVPFLLETVWGYDLSTYNDPGTVEVHISHLRKKLGPKLAKSITNLTGHGYKFEA
ncbi:MAG: response regulator transcription factor [Elusimicrobia bacterium]|nr:response regulator transcription factor [Elusimicrobiota bacterium]